MIPGFANEYDGRGPHYEVWYGKVDIAPETALWFRYTLLDGMIREASTWAILFEGGRAWGERNYWAIDALATPNRVIIPEGYGRERFLGHEQVFHVDDAHLDEANAIGSAGEIEWDLQWADSRRRFKYIPTFIEKTGLVRSCYDSSLMDLRMSGTVRRGDEQSWEIDGRPGMVGHIRGSKIAGDRWAWAHCNNFDEHPNAVFEGLSVNLQMLGTVTPPLSAFVLFYDGRAYPFRTPLSVMQAKSEFGRQDWRFEVESGGASLTGWARAPRNVALVEYDDTDGSKLWCHNSKLADLTLHLEDPEHGIDEKFRATGGSAFEYVTRETPTEEPLI